MTEREIEHNQTKLKMKRIFDSLKRQTNPPWWEHQYRLKRGSIFGRYESWCIVQLPFMFATLVTYAQSLMHSFFLQSMVYKSSKRIFVTFVTYHSEKTPFSWKKRIQLAGKSLVRWLNFSVVWHVWQNWIKLSYSNTQTARWQHQSAKSFKYFFR